LLARALILQRLLSAKNRLVFSQSRAQSNLATDWED
jgi:hypothetical protein